MPSPCQHDRWHARTLSNCRTASGGLVYQSQCLDNVVTPMHKISQAVRSSVSREPWESSIPGGRCPERWSGRRRYLQHY